MNRCCRARSCDGLCRLAPEPPLEPALELAELRSVELPGRAAVQAPGGVLDDVAAARAAPAVPAVLGAVVQLQRRDLLVVQRAARVAVARDRAVGLERG